MQIVIEIPESEIPKQQNIIEIPIHFIDGKICEAGGYGFAELPKGHGRLIDADKLEPHDEYDGQGFTTSVYKDDIDNLPTIIEADKEDEGK